MRLHALFMMGALAVAAQAWADEPRHVRVLWDVQGQRACAIAAVLQAPFTFTVPSEWPCGTGSDPVPSAGWTPVRSGVVRPGDYVTVYAIRYNPVSYKALMPVVTTLKPEEPIGTAMTVLRHPRPRPPRPAVRQTRASPPSARPFRTSNGRPVDGTPTSRPEPGS